MAIYHLKFPHLKHEENSIRGIRRAKRLGFTEIDLDMQITKDGVIVGTHWPRPMERDGFRDPLRRIAPSTTVRQMTFAQVSRLVALRRYRIQRIERLMRECARVGIIARLEPKDTAFSADSYWQYLAKVADDLGCEVRVYAFDPAAVAAAGRAGIRGKVIR